MSKLLDYLKAAGGEASLLTRLGFWRQAISGTVDNLVDLVSLVTGGGLLPATGTTTGSRPLNGYVTALLQTGDEVFVQGINELYYFDATSALTADGLNVVNAVGPGQFLRLSSVIVQADWYVDSVAGNDQNDGLTAGTALKTLSELARRTYGRVLVASAATFTVNLSGDFGFEYLQLSFMRANPETVVRVIGATTTVDAGTITAWQAAVPLTNTRRQLTDAAQDFTAHVGRRIRLTDGALAGYVTWIGSLGGGVTVANIGRFNWPQTGSDPVVGTAYVIEDMTTRMGGLILDVPDTSGDTAAGWNPSVESVAFVREGTRAFSGSLVNCKTECILRGCLFTVDVFNASVFYMTGQVTCIACCNDSHVFLQRGVLSGYSFVHRARFGLTRGGVLQSSQSPMHDGNGTRNCSLAIGDNGNVRELGDRSFWNCPNDGAFYSYCVVLYGGGVWSLSASGAVLWGNVGNAALAVVRVYNAAGVTYVTTPVAAGATPGNDYVMANAAPAAWATLPALAVSPNNAFFNLYQ